ncbi:MAG: hypothetical protein LUG86_00980 [Oscillospiraceae bacterium]|nr:hypothetical protein [Oscillospiraceae bacterium]
MRRNNPSTTGFAGALSVACGASSPKGGAKISVYAKLSGVKNSALPLGELSAKLTERVRAEGEQSNPKEKINARP